MKKSLVAILKIGISLGIFIYLHQTGKMDFQVLWDSFSHWNLWIMGLTLLCLNLLLSVSRWQLLLSSYGRSSVSYFDCIRVYWIALFFNALLPGKFGEAVIIFYSKGFSPFLKKREILYLLILDNAFGFMGLTTLAWILFALVGFQLDGNLLYALLFGTVVSLGGMGFYLILPKMSLQLPLLKQYIEYEKTHLHRVKLFAKSLLISLAGQALKTIAFFTLIKNMAGFTASALSGKAIASIPLGFLVTNSFSSSGLGVGNLIFQDFFSGLGIENGASLFNLYLVLMFSVALMGVIPFLLSPFPFSVMTSENNSSIDPPPKSGEN